MPIYLHFLNWNHSTYYFVTSVFNLFYLAALGLSCSMWDLVPWPGIEPRPRPLGAQSLSHWITRKVPIGILKQRNRYWQWDIRDWSRQFQPHACTSPLVDPGRGLGPWKHPESQRPDLEGTGSAEKKSSVFPSSERGPFAICIQQKTKASWDFPRSPEVKPPCFQGSLVREPRSHMSCVCLVTSVLQCDSKKKKKQEFWFCPLQCCWDP